MDWLSLLLPFSYLAILLASLGAFSHLYRRRQQLRTARLEPWFGPHTTRQIYLTLLEQASASSEPKEKGAPKIPDSILRAALLRRAVTDITRLIELRDSKQALAGLLQRGAVGDELWQRFLLAEKEMEGELKDVQAEANALSGAGAGQSGNWGDRIFASAAEMAQAEALSVSVAGIEGTRAEARGAWEATKAETRDEFMKELEGGGDKEDAVLVEAEKKKGKN